MIGGVVLGAPKGHWSRPETLRIDGDTIFDVRCADGTSWNDVTVTEWGKSWILKDTKDHDFAIVFPLRCSVAPESYALKTALTVRTGRPSI